MAFFTHPEDDLSSFDGALLSNRADLTESELEELFAEGLEFVRLKEFKRAAVHFENLLESARGCSDAVLRQSFHRRVVRELGILNETRLLNFEEAYRYYSMYNPLSVSERLWHCERIAAVCTYLGEEMFPEAADMYKRALINDEDSECEGLWYNHIGVTYSRLNELEIAYDYIMLGALHALKSDDAENFRLALRSLGQIFRLKGYTDVARRFFAVCLHEYATTEDERRELLRDLEWDVQADGELIVDTVRLPKRSIPLRVRLLSGVFRKLVLKMDSSWVNALQNCAARGSSREVVIQTHTLAYVDRVFGEAVRRKLLIYRPRLSRGRGGFDSNVPILIFFHGGGFAYGNPNQLDGFFKTVCHTLPCVVFAVNYRKAPEYPLPAALNDAKALTQVVVGTLGRERGGDLRRIVLGGESSGGQLALRVAHWIRDNQYELVPKENLYVLPIYPGIDPLFSFTRIIPNVVHVQPQVRKALLRATTPSFQRLRAIYQKGRRKSWNLTHSGPMPQLSFLERENIDMEQLLDQRPFSSLLWSVEDLPSMLIVTCEYDVFKPEADFYSQIVQSANPNASIVTFTMEAEVHAFLIPGFGINRNSMNVLMRAIVSNFRRVFPPANFMHPEPDDVVSSSESEGEFLYMQRVIEIPSSESSEIDDIGALLSEGFGVVEIDDEEILKSGEESSSNKPGSDDEG